MRSIPNHTPYIRPTKERVTNWLAWSSTTGRFISQSAVIVPVTHKRSRMAHIDIR